MLGFDMEMPKSCDVCPFVNENDDLMREDYRFLDCGFPHMGMFVTDYTASRHPDCPLEEIVSCGKCNHRKAPTDYCEKLGKAYMPDDFYCKYGKRKDGIDNGDT